MRNHAAPRDIPPPLELECLKALWRIGDGTVKDVRRMVTENRNLAYTTVMTVLDRLVKRGAAERRKTGRSFTYKPRVDRDALRHLALKEFVDSFFDGSEEQLLNYLSSSHSRPLAEAANGAAPASVDTEPLATELL
ncbi:MAG: BlaI/MecI/CopY family transcriptional regulator [Bryobacteraceae bacterium]|nr:BlaI/MecI/CopY family transcriptional regulator [Bryobacteraceae bacterium]